jgi:hypothetical protein
MLSQDEMRQIFEQTEIIRKPTYGIISGYHEIPYVCLGNALEDPSQTMRIKGKIQVSPRFVIRPTHSEPSYDEIFGEENVDEQLAGRMFGFFGFRGKPVECKSEHIEVEHLQSSVDRALAESIDEIERYEDITVGVLITPNSRYYPVSLEKLIASVLEDEFSV